VKNEATESLPTKQNHTSYKHAAVARGLSLAAMGGILLAATYLRLWGLEYSPTGGDQAVQLSIALRWVTQGKLPLAGHKYSVGLMSPPLTQYLLAFPLFVQRDLLGVTQFVALLNVASVALTYFAVQNNFGQRTALLATLLYAVNPWAVYYSRLTLNLSLVPLFSTLLLGSLLAAFSVRRKRLHLALTFLWVAAVIQLYIPSVALLPAVGLVFWIFRKQLTFKPLLIGALLFLLSFAPFLMYEIQTGFMDLTDFRQATSGTVHTNLAPVAIGLALSGEEGIWRTMGKAWSQWRAAVTWGESLRALAPWLILMGLLVVGWQLWRRRDEFRTRQFAPGTVSLVVVVALFAVPLLFYVRHTTYLQNYYFIYFYPLLFVIMALPAEAALAWADALPPAQRRVPLVMAWLLVALVLALAGRQFYLNHTGLQLMAQYAHGEQQARDSSAPQRKAGFTADTQQIRHVQQAIDTFADWSQRYPDCDLFIASNGYQPEGSILGQVGEFLAPHPVRYVRLWDGTIVPRACGLYLVASDDATVHTWYKAHTTSLPELTIHLPHDAWHFYEMAPPDRDALVKTLTTSPALGQWDNGVQLRRYAVTGGERPGSSLGLALTWEVYDTPPKKRYHFFNHLLDKDGVLVAQADGPGVFSRYWQLGEFFVTWFDIAVPPDAPHGIYQLAIGLYDWPSLERSHLTDGRDSLPLASIEILARN
jgi:hypothetical protein